MRILPQGFTVNPSVFLLKCDLGFLNLPPLLTFGEQEWAVKDEFHVSMIMRRHCVWKTDILRIAAQKIGFEIKPKPVLRRVRKHYDSTRPHIRETTVLMCDVAEGDRFYSEVERLTGIKIEPVPYHITLYTACDPESRQGIGLARDEELKELTEVLPLDGIPPALYDIVKRFI